MSQIPSSFKRFRFTTIFALAFALAGILLMTVGFLKTVFILFLTGVGAVAGFCLDDFDRVRKFVDSTFEKKGD